MQGTFNEQKTLHHQHRSSRKRRQAAGLARTHHEPSQKMKRDERLIRDAQHEARDVLQPNRPVLLMESDREAEIDKIIRSTVGDKEDIVQDAWVKVLESKASTDSEIVEASKGAKEKVRKVNNQHLFAERSLSEPIGKDKEEDLTLESLLPDKYVDEAPEGIDAPANFLGIHRNGGNSLRLDSETVQALRQKYPDLILSDAVRALLGLSPLPDKRHAWQKWEDNIIRDRYPCGGVFACKVDLTDRTKQAIRGRAEKLRVLRTGEFRGYKDWLTTKDVLKLLGMGSFRQNTSYLRKLVHDGVLDSIPVKEKHHINYLFTKDMVKNFLRQYPFKYDHEKLNGFRESVPKWVLEWINPEAAARASSFSESQIRHYIQIGAIPVKHGYKRRGLYVRIEDIQDYLKNKGRLSTKRPYEVMQGHGQTHFVEVTSKDSKGEYGIYVCRPGREFPISLKAYKFKKAVLRGYPTCKKCLGILQRYRK